MLERSVGLVVEKAMLLVAKADAEAEYASGEDEVEIAGDGRNVFECVGREVELAVNLTLRVTARELCWRRVLSKSAGCSRMADRRPEQRPAAK